jgi:hypothetical protein
LCAHHFENIEENTESEGQKSSQQNGQVSSGKPVLSRSSRPASRRSKDIPNRRWAISIIRSRGQFLGFVSAPDEAAAEDLAAVVFDLNEWQRRRLLIRESR